MQFDSLTQFLEMGGHGGYIWSAYAIALGVLAWNALSPWLARRRFLAAEARRARREEVNA